MDKLEESFKYFVYIVASMFLFSIIPAQADGKKLYQTHCAACHGDKGKGGVGVPLALKSFQSGVNDEYLFNSIRFGRPGRVMPAFSELSDNQVKSIVAYVRSFAKVKAPKFAKTRIKGNVINGEKLFKQNCAACHGASGKGGKGTGVTFSRPRDLPIIAPALNNSGYLKAASDHMIKHTLKTGRQGTPMVSFSKKGLKEKQLNDIVAYIRSFEKVKKEKVVAKNEPALIKVKSSYSFNDSVANLKKAIKGANFRIVRTQAFDSGLKPKAKESKDKVIIYFCNFKMLNDALAVDPRVGLFLPCRITVAKVGKDVYFYAINPVRLSRLFNNRELDSACANIKKLYVEIMEEANL